MARDFSFVLVLGCFFLSGFAALLYETAWTREFAFVFGTSELAVVSVLAAYMGGLAAGAAIAARFAARVRRPVLVYGVLELAIAACALVVPRAISATTGLYVALFGGLPAPPDEGQLAGALFHLGGSFLILLLPTALMGATLPLLARHAVRREEEIGRRIGLLYATNTAGAIGGTLVAAFVLLPALGLRQTVYCGAAVNALVFALAALLARRAPIVAVARDAAQRTALASRWILPLLMLSGFASFTYEVLWTRLISHVLGGSVFAFATMLASFLAGIALGAAAASRLATAPRRAGLGFAAAQIATALLSVIAFHVVDQLPELAKTLGAGSRSSLGPNALFAGAILVPPAFAIGTTLPFAVRLLAKSERDAAPASAHAYAWNTAGSIAGAVAAGFWLLPALDYAGTLLLAAGLNLVLAAAAALCLRPSSRGPIAAAAVGLVALAVFPPAPPWGLLRASPMGGAATNAEIGFYAVGRSATVLALERPSGWSLTTNGLPEASIPRAGGQSGRGIETRWLTMLPALVRPEARSMLLIGLGGALALEAVPATFDEIDVIELEPQVVAANRALGAHRGVDPLADPRARIYVNDARGSLLLTDRRYDAVVSQPSHPWTAGASHLYTQEFFSLVHSRLAPDGVFVQWIGLNFVDEPLLRSLVATLLDVFDDVQVYRPVPAALIFVASDEVLESERSAGRALRADPDGFARFGVRTPEQVTAARVLDVLGARAVVGQAELNTDDRNQLAMSSGRLRQGGMLRAARSRAFFEPFDSIHEVDGVDRLELVRSLVERREGERAKRVARAIPVEEGRATAMGWLALESGQPRAAQRIFSSALERNPADAAARFGLVRARLSGGADAGSGIESFVNGLSPAQAALVEATRAADADDWEAVQKLDSVLATARPGQLSYEGATRLRAGWRARIGDPEEAAESIALLDRTLLPAERTTDLLLRARAGLAANRPEVAIASLERTVRRTANARRSRATRPDLREAAELAAELPPGPRTDALRASLGRTR